MQNPQDCELTNPFQLYGDWWTADSDRKGAVSGCLSYTPDHGLQLQLYGEFPTKTLPWMKSDEPDQPIWGEVAGFAGARAKVSLFDSIRTNLPNDPAVKDKPPSHSIYYINQAIVGVHAQNASSLILASVEFSVSDFESFANAKPVPFQYDGHAIKIDYAPPEPVELRLSDPNMAVKIHTLMGWNSSLYERSFAITYRQEIELIPSVPMPFEEGMEAVFTLANFLTLCSRESVELHAIRGVLNSGERISSFGRMKGRKSRRLARDWVLTLNEMAGRLEDVLNRWFVLVKKLGLLGHVFFSELANPSTVTDARFFHFAGCLEAFHRDVVQEDIGKFLPRNEYKVIKQTFLDHLPSNLPEGLKSAIRSSLSQANDHSFFERIEALFNALEPATQQCLTDDPKRFLAMTRWSRNKLAHIADGTEHPTFEGMEYAHANLSMCAWLTILMLKECGIAESLIRDRMLAIQYFYWGPFKFESPANGVVQSIASTSNSTSKVL